MIHFVVKGAQKWTVYTLIKHGTIERKSDSGRTASTMIKIKNWN